MRKRLAMLGILLAGILACAQKPLPMEGSQQQKQSQSHADEAQPNTPPPCVSEVCKENAENAERYAYYKTHPEEYLKAAIAPANLSNWILASLGVIGGILALFTILTMRWSAERQLRAYVTVERGIIANVANPVHNRKDNPETVARIIDPQAGPTAQITIKNTGQTPAYNLIHWGSIDIREYPLTTKLPTMPKPDHSYWNVLGPTVPEVKTLRMPRPLTAEEIEGLRNGFRAIYCNGEIRYKDAFKKKRWTRYRCMYVAPACGIIGIGTDLVYCEEGNEAN
ncbi:MAG: hypothetical protein ACLP07_11670 [Terracidiphilus sp.]